MKNLLSDLVTIGIINEQDAIELQNRFDNAAVEQKEWRPLRILYFFFENKVINRRDNVPYFFSMDPYTGYKPDANADTSTYQNILAVLLKHNIISEIVYQKLKPFPLPDNPHLCLSILYLASDLTAFFENFSIEKQMKYMSLLGGTEKYGRDGILDSGKKNKLEKDINSGKVTTYFDFFRYCYCCDFINLKSYANNPQKLMDKLAVILNKLCYDSFLIAGITIKIDDFKGEPSYNNKSSALLINTFNRQHQFDYTFSENAKNKKAHSTTHLEKLLDFINKLLADYACTCRFTAVTQTLNKQLFPGSREIYAICRLQKENEKIFEFYGMQSRFLYSRPGHLFYNSPLSYTHIDYAVYHFKACGLLSHLSEKQLDQINKNIFSDTYKNIGDLLTIFPDTSATVSQNIAPGTKPYADFLTRLNTISRGTLNFTNINDGLPANFNYETETSFKITFNFNNIYHEVECQLLHKNFGYQLISYIINHIVKKYCPGYQLANFRGNAYGIDHFAFVTDEQIQYLINMKLNPFAFFPF